MASNYGSLVKQAIGLLDKFNAGRHCLDGFIEDAAKDLQNMDALHKKFVLDVVSGCIEHKNLLDVVINVFYCQNGKYLTRGDRSQFAIICYLIMFALDDLGLQGFSNIVKSLDLEKMQTFMTFFLTNLNTRIQVEWSKVYDAAYVEKHWIDSLLRWRPEIIILMEQLACGTQVKKVPVKTTVPKEFLLGSKPKHPSLPVPELIPPQEKCKPVPNNPYRDPKEIQKTEEMKKQNQQKTKKVVSHITVELDSKLKFSSFHASGLPPSNKTNGQPIKLNRAAIQRQKALHDRQMEEEVQRIERLVEGAREPSSFLQWQKEMREKDLQEELIKTERRRVERGINIEEAAMARTRMMERNQMTAQLKKEEMAELMQRYAEKRLQEEKEMRDLVQQVAEGHKNSKMAKERLQEFKQNIVKEVLEQNREFLQRALEEAQAELSKKFTVIHEIRAIESLPRNSVRNFDETETAGHGLLGEMSLAELRERLARLKEAQQAEQQEKREHILMEKQKEKQLLLEQLGTINLQRRALAHAAAVRKEEERKSRLTLQQRVAQDETLVTLQRQLEKKRQERQRLKQTESKKAKTSEKKTTTHTIKNIETHDRRSSKEKSWEELEQSLEHLIQRTAPYVRFSDKNGQ